LGSPSTADLRLPFYVLAQVMVIIVVFLLAGPTSHFAEGLFCCDLDHLPAAANAREIVLEPTVRIAKGELIVDGSVIAGLHEPANVDQRRVLAERLDELAIPYADLRHQTGEPVDDLRGGVALVAAPETRFGQLRRALLLLRAAGVTRLDLAVDQVSDPSRVNEALGRLH
jgi:hypothetical protein